MTTDNFKTVDLLLGDCLSVFPRLGEYGGRIDCILIDPPYNTHNSQLPYRDCRTDREWYDFIHSRIDAAYPFLSRRGCIAVHINDNLLGSLLRIMEEIFGKPNQLYITPWQAGKSGTGAGRAEFVVVFARDEASWKLQVVPRRPHEALISPIRITIREERGASETPPPGSISGTSTASKTTLPGITCSRQEIVAGGGVRRPW